MYTRTRVFPPLQMFVNAAFVVDEILKHGDDGGDGLG